MMCNVVVAGGEGAHLGLTGRVGGCYVSVVAGGGDWQQLVVSPAGLYLCSSRQTIQHWTLRHSGTAATSSRFFCCRGAAFNFTAVERSLGSVGRSKHWRAASGLRSSTRHSQLPRPFFVQTTLGGLATVHLVSVYQLRRRRQRRRKCRRSIGDNLACAVGCSARDFRLGGLDCFVTNHKLTIDLKYCLENIFPEKSWNHF